MLLRTRQAFPTPQSSWPAPLKAVLAAVLVLPLALSFGSTLPERASSWSNDGAGVLAAGETVITFDEGRSEVATEGYWRSQKSKSTKNLRTAPAPGTKAASLDKATRSGIFTTVPQTSFSLFPSQPAAVPTPPTNTRTAGGSYRTLCVRLCDGYYWPISFATGRDGFRNDAAVCENSCGSPARLFVYNNPGSGPEEMVDLKGRRYDRLKTAWNYRETYSAQCTCQPQPWDRASLDRHTKYAELQKAGKLSLYADNSSKRKKKKSGKMSYADLAAFTAGTAEDPNANGGLTRLDRTKLATNKSGKKDARLEQAAASAAPARAASPRPLASVVFGNERRLGALPKVKAQASSKPVRASAKSSGNKQKSWQKRAFSPDR